MDVPLIKSNSYSTDGCNTLIPAADGTASSYTGCCCNTGWLSVVSITEKAQKRSGDWLLFDVGKFIPAICASGIGNEHFGVQPFKLFVSYAWVFVVLFMTFR
ncbi:hypothetical protein AVEN_179583-1 [Araneus ventricosus]|uniref:Uncharacterized protein n=1 Tax=Araneus ventricosus TaxID=182803 RepID=A0A4Y2BC72_ARAVE|nr:hypothetical protein AVEN_179583-1 [Araneus ventricosus]